MWSRTCLGREGEDVPSIEGTIDLESSHIWKMKLFATFHRTKSVAFTITISRVRNEFEIL
jgi:hypothetical protein